ncbi:hypothetical protein A3216_02105 [Mycobacterium leprae 7935681]|nr:hypothetical protein A3216_02105 [Mycobacterium leprae 7935681]
MQSYSRAVYAHAHRVVWGKKDIVIPLSAGSATHDAIARSRLEILETGHMFFLSDPYGFFAVVEQFLQSVVLQPSS